MIFLRLRVAPKEQFLADLFGRKAHVHHLHRAKLLQHGPWGQSSGHGPQFALQRHVQTIRRHFRMPYKQSRTKTALPDPPARLTLILAPAACVAPLFWPITPRSRVVPASGPLARLIRRLALIADLWKVILDMSAQEVIEQIKALSPDERAQVTKFVVENDDSWIPDAFKEGMADIAAGRVVDLDTALNEPYPGDR